MASPNEMTARTVASGAVRVDAFEALLAYAGLDNMGDLPPRGHPLTQDEAARLLGVLLRKPVTLANFPPRMGANHLLHEVLESGEVTREELLRRVKRLERVAVLRPDGYLAWVVDGQTQQKVAPVEWREGAFRAHGFELGRFYTSRSGVFRLADAQMQQTGPLLAEVYDDADYISRTLDGAEEAFVELALVIGKLLTYPTDSLAALQHLPAGLVALIASSPEYLERLRYMTRGEQVKAISKLATTLIVTYGTAGGATRTLTAAMGGAEAMVPVLSLTAEGALVMQRIAVPVGTMATLMGTGVGSVYVLSTSSGGDGSNASGRSATEPTSSGPKVGSSGGPGTGKRFTEPVKDAEEARAGGKCVLCGKETTRTPGPAQRNTDHAIPKSRGGNNTLDNAQNTCRTCNLDKGAQTTEEYLRGGQ
jgi:hypothetical protein